MTSLKWHFHHSQHLTSRNTQQTEDVVHISQHQSFFHFLFKGPEKFQRWSWTDMIKRGPAEWPGPSDDHMDRKWKEKMSKTKMTTNMNLKHQIHWRKRNVFLKHFMEDSGWWSSLLVNLVTRQCRGWRLCSTELSAVNHLWQFLQQVVLTDVRVHVFMPQMVVSELIDQLLKVIHSGGGGSGAGGGGGAWRSYTYSPWLGLCGSLQDWAEMWKEDCHLFSLVVVSRDNIERRFIWHLLVK